MVNVGRQSKYIGPIASLVCATNFLQKYLLTCYNKLVCFNKDSFIDKWDLMVPAIPKLNGHYYLAPISWCVLIIFVTENVMSRWPGLYVLPT
jgi:hypothetical protein